MLRKKKSLVVHTDIPIPPIASFNGEHAFLSNFYVIDILLPTTQEIWHTSEAMYMAGKAMDPMYWEALRGTTTGGQAKRLGCKVSLRPDWNQIKDDHMLKCLRLKFTLNKECHDKLLCTGERELIEGNHWHDNYWGCCRCARCNGKGKNTLGRLLMQVRDELR